ncbi:MAG TPA: type II secretion system protein [Bacilli bacterium]|nr:type II secretion system protein [Bacilli bacterium]
MNKHFLNEKGITLTELLAALVLFAVVSALIMTVLFNVFRNSENISDNAQLRQDANLLISTLRSHYDQGDFEVGLNASNSLLIDGLEVNSSMTSSIDELELINGENSISAVNESMIVKADGTPLTIDLTLKNKDGQTYNLFTTIEKPDELAITLQVIEVPDPPEHPPGGFTAALSDYCKYRTEDTGYAYHASNQFIPDGCVNPVINTANVHFSNAHSNVIDLKHNTTKYNVGGNLFVDPTEFNVDNKHPMEVGGDAVFKGRLELKNEAEFIATNIHAGGDNNGRGIVVGNETRLEARESIVVAKTFHILSHGQAIIGKNLIANTVEAVNHSTIDINGSASISEKLKAAGNSQLDIGKNLIINGNLEMYDNVKIIVDGDARINGKLTLGGDSILKVKGNLTVTGDVIQDDNGYNGTIHVGTYNFSKGKPDWLNVVVIENNDN